MPTLRSCDIRGNSGPAAYARRHGNRYSPGRGSVAGKSARSRRGDVSLGGQLAVARSSSLNVRFSPMAAQGPRGVNECTSFASESRPTVTGELPLVTQQRNQKRGLRYLCRRLSESDAGEGGLHGAGDLRGGLAWGPSPDGRRLIRYAPGEVVDHGDVDHGFGASGGESRSCGPDGGCAGIRQRIFLSSKHSALMDSQSGVRTLIFGREGPQRLVVVARRPRGRMSDEGNRSSCVTAASLFRSGGGGAVGALSSRTLAAAVTASERDR